MDTVKENNVKYYELDDEQRAKVRESIKVFVNNCITNGFFDTNKPITQRSVENVLLTELCIRVMGGNLK